MADAQHAKAPAALWVVALVVTFVGASAACKTVISLFYGRSIFDLAAIGVLSGPGLLALGRASRGLTLAGASMCLVAVTVELLAAPAIAAGPIRILSHGRELATVPGWFVLGWLIGAAVLSAYVVWVLLRPDVKALFDAEGPGPVRLSGARRLAVTGAALVAVLWSLAWTSFI